LFAALKLTFGSLFAVAQDILC